MFRYKDMYKSIIHSSPQTTSNLKVHQSRTNKLYHSHTIKYPAAIKMN